MQTSNLPFVVLTSPELESIIAKTVQLTLSMQQYQSTPQDRPVNEMEAKKLLNVSRPTLLEYRKSGKLKFSRIGKRIFYKYSEIMIFIENAESKLSTQSHQRFGKK